MAYADTWNAAFEAAPGDSDAITEGAERIRDTRTGIRERLEHDHYMAIAGTDADHGEHKQITFNAPLGADPANGAEKGALYTKDVATKVELFWEDEDGNVIQLTAGGVMNPDHFIEAGTKMVFYQDAAPTGWTIENTLDDKLLFITKGSVAGGETGGGAHASGTWTQPDHTHTGPSHTHTGPSHTHTGPSHNHQWYEYDAGDDWSFDSAGTASDVTVLSRGNNKVVTGSGTGNSFNEDQYTDLDGTGNTGAGGTGNTGASGTGATAGGATANTWRPNSYCAIIATKD